MSERSKIEALARCNIRNAMKLRSPNRIQQTRRRSGSNSSRFQSIEYRKAGAEQAHPERYVRWFDDLSSDDLPIVGGKNASLGEMTRAFKRKKIQIPSDRKSVV